MMMDISGAFDQIAGAIRIAKRKGVAYDILKPIWAALDGARNSVAEKVREDDRLEAVRPALSFVRNGKRPPREIQLRRSVAVHAADASLNGRLISSLSAGELRKAQRSAHKTGDSGQKDASCQQRQQQLQQQQRAREEVKRKQQAIKESANSASSLPDQTVAEKSKPAALEPNVPSYIPGVSELRPEVANNVTEPMTKGSEARSTLDPLAAEFIPTVGGNLEVQADRPQDTFPAFGVPGIEVDVASLTFELTDAHIEVGSASAMRAVGEQPPIESMNELGIIRAQLEATAKSFCSVERRLVILTDLIENRSIVTGTVVVAPPPPPLPASFDDELSRAPGETWSEEESPGAGDHRAAGDFEVPSAFGQEAEAQDLRPGQCVYVHGIDDADDGVILGIANGRARVDLYGDTERVERIKLSNLTSTGRWDYGVISDLYEEEISQIYQAVQVSENTILEEIGRAGGDVNLAMSSLKKIERRYMME